METVDLEIEQGATYRVTLDYTDEDDQPIPLTGYKAHMQIRKRHGSPVLVDLSSEGDQTHAGITIDTPGEIDIYIGATVTATLTSRARYDLHLVDESNPDEVDRVFGGAVLITPAITVDAP